MKELAEKNLMASFEVKQFATKTGVKTQLIIQGSIVKAETSKDIYIELFDLVKDEIDKR